MKCPAHSLILILLPTQLLLAIGCAHVQPKVTPPPVAQLELLDSEIEISYGLGHTHRKLILRAKDFQITGQSYLDRQVLKENIIEPVRYQAYLKAASELTSKCHRSTAAEPPPCRSPFTLHVRVGAATQTLKGCRSNDEGSLSRLLRDGEFLLYIKK